MRKWHAAVLLSAVVFAARPAYGQVPTTSVTKPPTQDSQLRSLLALGDANGCIKFLGLPANSSQDDVANALKTAQISKELRAICGPSAVASASSLSGGINTVLATKSTSTFRPKPRPKSKRPSARRSDGLGMYGWSDAGSTIFQIGGDQEVGAAVFGGFQVDKLTRTDTEYESGYSSTLTGFTGGADYRSGDIVAGGWFGRSQATADFTRFSALLSGVVDPASTAVLSSPANLSAICGGISNGGNFKDSTTHLGGFVKSGLGNSGFVQGSVSWARQNHDYTRSVCAIEGNPGMKLGTVNGKTVLVNDNGTQIDDIFAGTISGLRTAHEMSFAVGAGGEFGSERVSFTPHAELTVRRTTSDAYAETGRSTVMGIEGPTGTGTVTPNTGDPVKLTIGGPTGFELVYEASTRTSIALESGGVVAVRAGRAIPYAGGYWRREFKTQYPIISARMAGDLRATPATFTFGNDAFDRDSLMFKFGCAVTGEQGSLRFEWSLNRRDVLVDYRSLSAHAVIVF